jgi:hypothetical protein
MVLHREERKLPVTHALDASIVEVQVGHFEGGSAGNTTGIANHSEAMVLSGDQHLPGAEIPHRMVSSPVTVRHLGRLSTEGEPHQLVPEADAERGQPAAGELPDAPHRVLHRRGVSRAVGKEETIGL